MNRSRTTIITLFVISSAIFAQDINYIPKSDNALIVQHKHYALSYIGRYHDPEWVAYKLEDYMTIGTSKRSNRFKSDPNIPGGTALPTDYSKSGYDRGHMCPAADMKWDPEAMEETFYMSNMAPQDPSFNRGIWEKLEEQVRDWALEFKKIYIVTGAILVDGLPTIGRDNDVSVPKYFYKIILQYDKNEKKAIAFLMPNRSSSLPITDYVVPIDSIETLTRINFFPSLIPQLSEALEKHVDISKWHFIIQNTRATNVVKRYRPYN